MRRYPGNFTDSDLLTVPRDLKVRPDHDTTHLAYITDKEADLLQKNKPGTPHKGPKGIPNYDGGDILTYTPSGMSGTGYQGPTQQQQQEQRQHNEKVSQQVVDTFNRQQGTNQKDTYQAPSQVYGPGQAIPGETGYASVNIASDEASWNKYYSTWKEIQNMDPKTLAFFGYKPGSYNLPNELMAMVAEGSIVGSNEAMYNDIDPDTPGIQTESGVGTWSDLEAGRHPLLGGTDTYYDIMNNPTTIDTSNTGGGGGGGGGGWGDSWGAGGDYSGGGGGGGGYGYAEEDFTPRGNPNELWGQQNPLQQAMISIHGGQGFQQGFARGGIVSLVA